MLIEENNMRVVKFLRKYTKYNKGEIAGFDDKRAADIVDEGFGVYHEVEEKKEKPTLSNRPTLNNRSDNKQARANRENPSYQTK